MKLTLNTVAFPDSEGQLIPQHRTLNGFVFVFRLATPFQLGLQGNQTEQQGAYESIDWQSNPSCVLGCTRSARFWKF